MPANRDVVSDPGPTALDFNKELLSGECGALLVANSAALVAAHYTPNPGIISGTAVVGTLAGGSLFWLAVRFYHRRRTIRRAGRAVANDIGYFTPAAIGLGLVIYDPSMYATSHFLLRREAPVAWAVSAGQGVAFALFAGAMNLYRLLLRRVSGKRL